MNTKYHKRTITLMSAPRSGSTFIWQIMKMIFGKVSSSHDYCKNCEVIVFRNFLDSAISHYRVLNDKPDNFLIKEIEVIDNIKNNYLPYCYAIKKTIDEELGKKLYFVYEFDIKTSSGNNYKKIFQKISQHYEIVLSNKTKKRL